MVNNEKELLEAIKHEHHIKKEITDTLIELDQLPSTGTQVYLNELIVTLYKRVVDKSDDIIVEIFADKVMTPQDYISWVEDNFTEYSANLFKKTIEEE
ncbi:MAG: hypothetical protein IJU77_08885 [Butyrivibrio sp.]|nr:hypothetical protein [Butyrivibrio sp.]